MAARFKFVSPLEQIAKRNVRLAGGKAASLGELSRIGMPIPPAFVIRASAFRKFIDSNWLWPEIDDLLKEASRDDALTGRVSTRIAGLLKQAPLPAGLEDEIRTACRELEAEYVSVRSSAAMEDGRDASWAGQLDTFLNVTEKDVIDSVRRCWSSIFNPRALSYRSSKRLGQGDFSMAILVQRMVQSESAGVAFSENPATGNDRQIVVEAGWGLGEGVVSGSVTPDTYVVDKRSGRTLNRTTGAQSKMLCQGRQGRSEWTAIPARKGNARKLPAARLKELRALVLKIERHFGFPVDVEWAVDKSGISILQARPITASSLPPDSPLDPGDYSILFRMKNKANFLINSFLLEGSLRQADPLIINRDGSWTFYLHRKGIERLERTGLELFDSSVRFERYAAGFRDYLTRAKDEIIPTYQNLGPLDLSTFRKMMRDLSPLWLFYGFTESVYHDFTYIRMTETGDRRRRKRLRQNLDTLVELKDKGRAVFNAYAMSGGIIRRALEAIESQAGLRSGDASYLTIEELEQLLRGRPVDSEVLAERKKAYALTVLNNRWKTFGAEASSRLAETFHRFELSNHTKARTGLAGTSANGGTARGRVVIAPMLDHAEAAKVAKRMRKGDILVVQSTNPELTTLIEKAGAIVTDQGGMLSHAAVISREMGKPCVVGTSIATKVLKDGDRVEVNADAGTVTKLGSQGR